MVKQAGSSLSYWYLWRSCKNQKSMKATSKNKMADWKPDNMPNEASVQQKTHWFHSCYLKTHSYVNNFLTTPGLNAISTSSNPYYPKLVACIPFTRLLAAGCLLILSSWLISLPDNNSISHSKHRSILRKHTPQIFSLFIFTEYQATSFAKGQANCQRLKRTILFWAKQGYKKFSTILCSKMTCKKAPFLFVRTKPQQCEYARYRHRRHKKIDWRLC